MIVRAMAKHGQVLCFYLLLLRETGSWEQVVMVLLSSGLPMAMWTMESAATCVVEVTLLCLSG